MGFVEWRVTKRALSGGTGIICHMYLRYLLCSCYRLQLPLITRSAARLRAAPAPRASVETASALGKAKKHFTNSEFMHHVHFNKLSFLPPSGAE